MTKTRVHFIEVIKDEALRAKEARATAAVKRVFPEAGPVKLYRTTEGRIGFELDVRLGPGDRKRLDSAYSAIMKALGEKRGRPRSVKTVQTKLLLPESTYRALKLAAARSGSTLSGLVDRLAKASLQSLAHP